MDGLYPKYKGITALRHGKKEEGMKRQLGCLIAGKDPLSLIHCNLLPKAPVGERALLAQINSPIGIINAGSFHAPPGVI